uniref:Uncharacterized protein n=1 Tax=Parascaris equorum TaxID=6256 RepID=A0A914RYW2_PAREQ
MSILLTTLSSVVKLYFSHATSSCLVSLFLCSRRLFFIYPIIKSRSQSLFS